MSRLAGLKFIICILLSVLLTTANAQDFDEAIENVQSHLSEVYAIEHSLLYPASGLLFVSFSQSYGADIFLEKVELTLDGRSVLDHTYSWEDVAKLMDGAVQQMLVMLIPPGEHQVSARLFGRGLINRDYLFGELTFKKGHDPVYLQVSILGNRLHFEQW